MFARGRKAVKLLSAFSLGNGRSLGSAMGDGVDAPRRHLCAKKVIDHLRGRRP